MILKIHKALSLSRLMEGHCGPQALEPQIYYQSDSTSHHMTSTHTHFC